MNTAARRYTATRRYTAAPGFQPTRLAPEQGHSRYTSLRRPPAPTRLKPEGQNVSRREFPGKSRLIHGSEPSPARVWGLVADRPVPSPPSAAPAFPDGVRASFCSEKDPCLFILQALPARASSVSTQSPGSGARDQRSSFSLLRALPRTPTGTPQQPRRKPNRQRRRSRGSHGRQRGGGLLCDSEVLLSAARNGDCRASGVWRWRPFTVLSMQRLLFPPLKALMGSPCLRLLVPRAAPRTQVPHRCGLCVSEAGVGERAWRKLIDNPLHDSIAP